MYTILYQHLNIISKMILKSTWGIAQVIPSGHAISTDDNERH